MSADNSRDLAPADAPTGEFPADVVAAYGAASELFNAICQVPDARLPLFCHAVFWLETANKIPLLRARVEEAVRPLMPNLVQVRQGQPVVKCELAAAPSAIELVVELARSIESLLANAAARRRWFEGQPTFAEQARLLNERLATSGKTLQELLALDDSSTATPQAVDSIQIAENDVPYVLEGVRQAAELSDASRMEIPAALEQEARDLSILRAARKDTEPAETENCPQLDEDPRSSDDFVQLTQLMKGRYTNYKAARAAVEKGCMRWKKPKKNRLLISARDWHDWHEEQDKQGFRTMAKIVDDVERRTAEIPKKPNRKMKKLPRK